MRGTDYVLKRVGFAIVTVFVAVTINFVLFRLAPGSAVSNLSRVPELLVVWMRCSWKFMKRPSARRLMVQTCCHWPAWPACS